MVRRLLITLVLVLDLSPFAPGQDGDKEIRLFDKIVKKGGEPIEGEILNETSTKINLVLPNGIRFTIDRSEVQEIIRRNPPEQAYRARLKELERESGEAQFALGRWCATEAELWEQGITHLVEANRLDPERVEVYTFLLPLLRKKPLSEQNFAERDRALGVYLRGIEAGVADPEIFLGAGRILAESGEIEGAIALLRMAFPGDGSSGPDPLLRDIEYLLVELLQEQGRVDEARALVTDLLSRREGADLHPLLLRYARWLIEDLAAGVEIDEKALESTLSKAIEVDPSMGEAFALRGAYESLRGDFESAKGSTLTAFQKRTVDYRIQVTAALLNARTGFFETAQVQLDHCRPASGEEAHLKSVRAYLLANRGETEAAANLIAAAARDPAATWQTGILYLQNLLDSGDEDRFAAEANRFLNQFGDRPVAFSECALLLGHAALRKGDGPAARRWLEYVATVSEPDHELSLHLAQAHLLPGGQRSRARALLQRAFDLDPDHLDTYNTFGYLEYLEGNLVQSREWFDRVIRGFTTKEREAVEPPSTLAYALRGRDHAHAALTEEVISDNFQREDGESVLNNWEEEERLGIEIQLRDGAAVFEGEQQFDTEGGLTTLWRSDPSGDRLRRLRAVLRLGPGADRVRVGVRLDAPNGDGLVFFRRLDGVLAFSLNKGGESEVVEPRAENAEDVAESVAQEVALRKVVWPDDGQEHVLEVRVEDSRGRTVGLFFDGERVARDVRLPGVSRRGERRLGVSGQATAGTRYRFELTRFDVFRRLPDGKAPERR